MLSKQAVSCLDLAYTILDSQDLITQIIKTCIYYIRIHNV